SCAASRSTVSECLRRSPTSCCSSPRRSPPGSPARPSPSTAASRCDRYSDIEEGGLALALQHDIETVDAWGARARPGEQGLSDRCVVDRLQDRVGVVSRL